MVAHNARFDHAFLRAEFDRVGIVLDADVLCSVMLSRKLYPQLAHHDLDSLAEHHGLRVEVRHRALPDADLVRQWWELIHKRWPGDVLRDIVSGLIAGPVLPAHLAASLVDKLPEAPGAYMFHGERNQPLCVGAAGNLKRHVLDYFRIDRATSASREYSHRITNITYRRARGMLGARLHAATLNTIHFADATRKVDAYTWRFTPDALPPVAVAALSDDDRAWQNDSFGIFSSERRARNALVRLASRKRLCHSLLPMAAGFGNQSCTACADNGACVCADRIARNRQLLRICDCHRAVSGDGDGRTAVPSGFASAPMCMWSIAGGFSGPRVAKANCTNCWTPELRNSTGGSTRCSSERSTGCSRTRLSI